MTYEEAYTLLHSMHIDHRRHYRLVCDTETANGLRDPLPYNVGFAVIDTQGRKYFLFSCVIDEVFFGMPRAMRTAYFAEKIPQYIEDIHADKLTICTFNQMRQLFHDACRLFDVEAICAHNASFDVRALHNDQCYLTCSMVREFFPEGIPIWDSVALARQTICTEHDYIEWCKANGYMTQRTGPRASAEVLYRYLSGNNEFAEEHRAIEDVLIETEILTACLAWRKRNKLPLKWK